MIDWVKICDKHLTFGHNGIYLWSVNHLLYIYIYMFVYMRVLCKVFTVNFCSKSIFRTKL